MNNNSQRNTAAYQHIDAEEGVEMFSRHRSFSGDTKVVGTIKGSIKSSRALVGALLLVICVLILILPGVFPPAAILSSDSPSSAIQFDDLGRYIMRNYDEAKPMSNFLPGLGGLWGFPMWAFYVNRGQGIASFGKQNKDGGIMKFSTANVAYQQTPFTGFRTFLKATRAGQEWNHMPFYPRSAGKSHSMQLTRDMFIGSSEMEIVEVASDVGLQTNILYFTSTNESFPSLIRRVTFKNLDRHDELSLDVLDGLGRLIPQGLIEANLDSMGRTQEAWMRVYNTGESSARGHAAITQPFFHISQGTADSAEVQVVNDGYFSVAFIDSDEREKENTLLPFVVDPNVVYGYDTTLTNPSGFFSSSLEEVLASPQGTSSRTPCAFAGASVTIAPRSSVTISTVYGYAKSLEHFLDDISPRLVAPKYIDSKREASQKLVSDIVDKVETKSGLDIFDQYVEQNFLDNVLRGGLPLKLGDVVAGDIKDGNSAPKIFHVFSRIHGDIERDYNNFQIDTTYFSQGPGNFRDVNQNRRLDVFHSPEVKEFNVRMFLSFIQADGYNPLTVASTNFKVQPEALSDLLVALRVREVNHSSTASTDALRKILSKSFRPGTFFQDVMNAGVDFGIPKEDVLATIVGRAEQAFAATYAQNGYWADHWTYTLDLMDNFVSVYPNEEYDFLWENNSIPFFMSPAYVKVRDDRYQLVPDSNNPGSSTIRVYSAVSSWGDAHFSGARQDALNSIYASPDYVADSSGNGGVWQRTISGSVFKVSPVAKFLMLGILKFSTMDPFGMGVEMEGGKPGWNDAMNGLPGLLGSGMPELYEAMRVLRYVRKVVGKSWKGVYVPTEFFNFYSDLQSAMLEYTANVLSLGADEAEFPYWNSTNNAREKYREDIIAHFSGSFVYIPAEELVGVLDLMLSKMEKGVAKAVATSETGVSPTYFWYECSSYELFNRAGISEANSPQVVRTKGFTLKTLPLFLEGPTRQMKVTDRLEDRRAIYKAVRNSALYDTALEMFAICASLAGSPQGIGRMMAFSAGWLENQSIWLHMSYKWYLELLRGELYDEFFSEIQTGLVPFMNATVYGRSPTEAASFIVSSAFSDSRLHGSSYLARLSGSTAEFLSMWAHMMAGPAPFTLNEHSGSLQLTFCPVLPSWLFGDDNTVSFTFLGAVRVTYSNPSRKDTWTVKPISMLVTDSSGHSEQVLGGTLDEHYAKRVRDLDVQSIFVQF